MTPGAIARGGVVQCPETRELFGDMTVGENLDLGGQHLPGVSRARQLDWPFELFPVNRSGAVALDEPEDDQEKQFLER